MVNKMIISELLFFVINKFGSVPVDQLKKIINDFYTVSDIRAAKELLCAELVKLMVPDMADATPVSYTHLTLPTILRV